MKKISFVALVAAFLFVGCAKHEPVSVTDGQELKIEYTVADKTAFGVDTKAVKDGWAYGDGISIVFSLDEMGNNYITTAKGANRIVLAYQYQNLGCSLLLQQSQIIPLI